MAPALCGGYFYIKEAKKMKEIDKIAKKIKKLQSLNSPFMVAVVKPVNDDFSAEYVITQNTEQISKGNNILHSKNVAIAYCENIQYRNNITDDKCIIINIIKAGDRND